MAIAQVGSVATASSGTTAVTSQSITIAPTAGNCVVVCVVGRGNTTTGYSVAAVGGTATFTKQVAEVPSSGNGVVLIFTAVNVGSGITGVTVTSPSTFVMSCAIEYSGVDNTTPMDVTPVISQGASATAQSSTSISPVTSGAVVVAALSSSANSATATPFKATTAGPTQHTGTNAGAGWASKYDRWNQGGSGLGLNIVVAADAGNTTSGAYQCDWTMAVAALTALGAIALRPAGATTPPNLFFAMF